MAIVCMSYPSPPGAVPVDQSPAVAAAVVAVGRGSDWPARRADCLGCGATAGSYAGCWSCRHWVVAKLWCACCDRRNIRVHVDPRAAPIWRMIKRQNVTWWTMDTLLTERHYHSTWSIEIWSYPVNWIPRHCSQKLKCYSVTTKAQILKLSYPSGSGVGRSQVVVRVLWST